MLENTAFDLSAVGQNVMKVYLIGLGFKPKKK